MLNRLQFAFNYLFYFFTADSAHGVHSPFVYNFVTAVLNVRRNKPVYHSFELLRSRMLKSKAMIDIEPIGASKFKGQKPLRKIVKQSAKSAKYAELLERICAYYAPQYAIEIGCSAGISTMYQAAGMPQGYLFALEGNAGLVKVARHNMQEAGLEHVQIVEGLFEDMLPRVVQELPRIDYVFFDGNHSLEATLTYFEWCLQKAHTGSVFVFDDIRWSDEMLLAWSKIKNHPQVTLSIDLYVMGLVFFRKEQEKEDFTLRF